MKEAFNILRIAHYLLLLQIHRVQGFGKESECRQSIPYFLHPDALVVVRPLVGDAEKYPPITAGDYWKLNLGRKMGL